jgi:hypothetical protein
MPLLVLLQQFLYTKCLFDIVPEKVWSSWSCLHQSLEILGAGTMNRLRVFSIFLCFRKYSVLSNKLYQQSEVGAVPNKSYINSGQTKFAWYVNGCK